MTTIFAHHAIINNLMHKPITYGLSLSFVRASCLYRKQEAINDFSTLY